MEIHSSNYVLDEILDLSFKTVPRGIFVSPIARIALDYYSMLLCLHEHDRVEIRLYTKKPDINKSIYLMRGIVYKIDEDGFECSCGGLLLLYKGEINESITNDMELFVSVAKI